MALAFGGFRGSGAIYLRKHRPFSALPAGAPDGECDPDMLERFRIVSEQEFETIENETQQRESEGSGSGQWTEQLSAIKQQMEQEEKNKKH